MSLEDEIKAEQETQKINLVNMLQSIDKEIDELRRALEEKQTERQQVVDMQTRFGSDTKQPVGWF